MVEGQINLRDAVRRHDHLHQPRGQAATQLNDKTGHAAGPPARLAPGREARAGRRRADLAPRCSTSGCTSSTTPRTLIERGHRAVLLPAEAGEPPRGAAVERRLQLGAGRAGHPARDDPGHGPDRDDPGGLRDGRDPLRAARPLGRAELRPLGLHLQLHQEVPQPPRLRPARPRAGHDDHAFMRAYSLLAIRPATAAASTRWAAWRRRSRSRTTRRPTRRRSARCAPTSSARRPTATTAPGWPTPGLVPLADGGVRREDAGAEPDRPQREDVHVTARDLLDGARRPTITEAGLRTNINVGIQYLASWLRGNGCVPIYNLMEDAATAEISRAQLWQWVHHANAVLDDGRPVDGRLVRGADRRGAGEAAARSWGRSGSRPASSTTARDLFAG